MWHHARLSNEHNSNGFVRLSSFVKTYKYLSQNVVHKGFCTLTSQNLKDGRKCRRFEWILVGYLLNEDSVPQMRSTLTCLLKIIGCEEGLSAGACDGFYCLNGHKISFCHEKHKRIIEERICTLVFERFGPDMVPYHTMQNMLCSTFSEAAKHHVHTWKHKCMLSAFWSL